MGVGVRVMVCAGGWGARCLTQLVDVVPMVLVRLVVIVVIVGVGVLVGVGVVVLIPIVSVVMVMVVVVVVGWWGSSTSVCSVGDRRLVIWVVCWV